MGYIDDIGPVGRSAGAWNAGAGGEPPDAARFEAEAQAAQTRQAGKTAAGDGGAAAREVLLDVTQVGLDIAGISTPHRSPTARTASSRSADATGAGR